MNIVITDKDQGRRIDLFLRDECCISRKEIQRQISCVTVNGKAVKQNYLLQLGDRVKFNFDIIGEEEPVKIKIPLTILYEDDDIVVIDKPSGVLTSPAAKNLEEPSVVSGLLALDIKLARTSRILEPGVVHRLDRGCSGVLLFAKTNKSLEYLKKQFSRRNISKTYHAVVHNVPKQRAFVIEKPISLLQRTWKAKIDYDGKESITRVILKKKLKGNRSLLKCIPITGRTHQIRVHLTSCGFPIIGDNLYNLCNNCRVCAKSRLMLHSSELGFIHPLTRKELVITSPLPHEFGR